MIIDHVQVQEPRDQTGIHIDILAEKTEKVCEMAAVMKEAVWVDEENCNLQQKVMVRLVPENKVDVGGWMITKKKNNWLLLGTQGVA